MLRDAPERIADARRGDLVPELAIGGIWGATGLAYEGEILWDDNSRASLATRGIVGVEPRFTRAFTIGLAAGLSASLDVGARARLFSGAFQHSLYESVEGANDWSQEGELTRYLSWGAELFLRRRILEDARVSPVLEIGPAVWRLPLSESLQSELPSTLPRFPGFTWPGARVAFGAEFAAAPTFDVAISAPLYLLFGAQRQGWVDGDPDLLSAVGGGEPIGFVAGLELSLRPRVPIGRTY